MAGKARWVVAALSVSAAGLASLAHDEGTVSKVYLDVVNIPTVCMGTTAGLTHKDVGRVLTDLECNARNKAAVQSAERAVKAAVKVPLTQQQYDVLVSFTYNVGNAAMQGSTMLKYLNAGECQAAAAQMLRWDKAKGRVVRGLTLRRQRDAAAMAEDCL